MDEKLSVKQLLQYYVDRYALSTENMSHLNEKTEDGLGAYYAELRRIMMKTRIGEARFWDIIKPEGGGERRVSVQDFERVCFAPWCKYIENLPDSQYDFSVLQADKERWTHEMNWRKYADGYVRVNKLIREEGYEFLNDMGPEDVSFEPSNEELQSRGHEMMLEALYDVFYERFDWERLRADMHNEKYISYYSDEDDFYNEQIITSLIHLQSYHNYIGNRKRKST